MFHYSFCIHLHINYNKYWALCGLRLLLISVLIGLIICLIFTKNVLFELKCDVSRESVRAVIAAATAHMTSVRITLETVFLWKTAPVCTAGGCSVLDRVSKATAKPGSVIISLGL